MGFLSGVSVAAQAVAAADRAGRAASLASLCQVPNCGKSATFHSFPANAVHPDEGGMQTCDAHLAEGMSHIPNQPAPDHWRVFPIHPSKD